MKLGLGLNSNPLSATLGGGASPARASSSFGANQKKADDFSQSLSRAPESKPLDKNLNKVSEQRSFDGKTPQQIPENVGAQVHSPSGSPEIDQLTTPENKDIFASLPPAKRQDAMVEFLEKMQKEFGVSPEELIKAFSNLSDEALMAPPQESMDELLGALNLTGADQAQAGKMFQKMLVESKGQQEPQSANGQGIDHSFKIMTQQEARKATVNQSLDKMNDSFFIDNKALQVQKNQAGAVNPNGLAAYQNQLEGSNSAQKLSETSFAGPMPTEEMTTIPVKIPEAYTGKGLANSEQTGIENSMNSQALQKAIAQQNQVDSQLPGNDQAAEEVFNQNQSTGQTTVAAPDQAIGGGVGMENNGSEMNDEGQSESQLGAAVLSKTKTADSTKPGSSQFVVETATSNDTDDAANIHEVIGRARFMAKKGGGEMRIQLQPEGLGEVGLKVNYKDGKLNVEMMASSNEAKKSLESGLLNLRASLATPDISMKDINVDVSNNLGSEKDLTKHDEERAYQQRFLEEFRQNNNKFQREFYGINGARPVKSQTRDEADNDYRVENSGRKKSNESRRLNLVA